ncbi:MAG: polyketide synthase PksM, partial [Alphaproteobacteria bacterium]|nr:polyketide synthase PksM [Alphaproteobacteria bacterium]
IGSRFGVALEAAFFFEHNTCERIITRIRELVRARTQAPAADQLSVAVETVADRADESFEPAHDRVTGQSEDDATGCRKQDVAIVGVACLLPGGIGNPEELWKLLDERRGAISRLPPWRWVWPSTIDPEEQHRGIDAGGFAQGIEQFDAGFFRISPREAALMDPQQRILLQLSWACLEDAGEVPESIAGTRTGVFVGASGSDYQLRLSKEMPEEIDAHFGLATSMAVLANRLSYYYDLTGPSIQVDGACSSSLVALHQATKAINTGECSQAIVAGINIMCDPASSIAFYKAGMLAPDGKCKTFDKAANGYVRGEGAVVMLLKPLAGAIQDENRIYGIIKGTATNHGGRAAGLTVPHPARQADLIEQAFHAAGIDSKSIGYVEAHGTGTSLGDPIEVRGLTEAFARCSVADHDKEVAYCGLGSVKANIGHLEAAAGLAGLLKALLCIRHRTIPASLNFSELNPHISLAASPFYVAEKSALWELRGRQQVRRAGVSSFGSGGANAHAIVEEYVAPRRNAPNAAGEHGPALIVLSARDQQRLRARVEQLVAAIDQGGLGSTDVADIAYTLQVGREAMECRLATTAGSVTALQAKLRAYLDGNSKIEDLYQGQVKQNKETITAFAEDEELQEAVAKWIARGKYRKLLALWVKGFPVDWQQLYGRMRPKRIGLPTYPFAGDRHWLLADTKAEQETVSFGTPPEQLELGSLVTLAPVWQPVAATGDFIWPSPKDRVVIVGATPACHVALRQYYPHARQLEIPLEATPEMIGEQLGVVGPIDHIVWLSPQALPAFSIDGAMIDAQQQGVLQCFRLIKAVLALGHGDKALGWTVITTQCQAVHRHDAIDPTHASVHGLIGSMAKEYPNWQVRLVDLPLSDDWPLDELLQLPADPQGKGWGYREGEWYRQFLLPIELPEAATAALYRRRGVYVVIGGASGIGEAWSEYMIRVYQAQIVWIGPRPQDTPIRNKLDRLAKLGPAPLYIEADASDRWALERAYARIKQEHEQVHGVIHSAIVLRDKSLARMDEASFCAMLAANVDVSVRMGQVFCEDPLDFVLFFSALSGFDSSADTSNYAAGCDFKDAFAYQLGVTWSCPVKVVNWDCWDDIGVVASADDVRTRMARAGLGSIEAEEGMAALEMLLAAPQNQLALVKVTRPLGTEGGLAAFECSGSGGGVPEQPHLYSVEMPSTVVCQPQTLRSTSAKLDAITMDRPEVAEPDVM